MNLMKLLKLLPKETVIARKQRDAITPHDEVGSMLESAEADPAYAQCLESYEVLDAYKEPNSRIVVVEWKD